MPQQWFHSDRQCLFPPISLRRFQNHSPSFFINITAIQNTVYVDYFCGLIHRWELCTFQQFQCYVVHCNCCALFQKFRNSEHSKLDIAERLFGRTKTIHPPNINIFSTIHMKDILFFMHFLHIPENANPAYPKLSLPKYQVLYNYKPRTWHLAFQLFFQEHVFKPWNCFAFLRIWRIPRVLRPEFP